MRFFILTILVLVMTTFAAEKRDTVTIINCKCDTTVIVQITKDTSVIVKIDTLKTPGQPAKEQSKKIKTEKKKK